MTEHQETLTLPEVAHLEGIQTDTLRMFYRRGYLENDGSSGWRRYSLRDAAATMFFIQVHRATRDYEIAQKARESFLGYMAEQSDGYAPEGAWLVFYRTAKPLSEVNRVIQTMRAETADSEAPYGLFLEMEEIDNERQAFQFLKELTQGESLPGHKPIIPTIVPIHAIWADVALRLDQYIQSRKKGSTE